METWALLLVISMWGLQLGALAAVVDGFIHPRRLRYLPAYLASYLVSMAGFMTIGYSVVSLLTEPWHTAAGVLWALADRVSADTAGFLNRVLVGMALALLGSALLVSAALAAEKADKKPEAEERG